MRWKPTRLFFQLELGVDIVSKEAFLTMFEMPDLVHLEESVPESKRFLQLGSTPRSSQGAMLWIVRAAGRFGSKRTIDLGFHTGSTQRKRQFVGMAVRQHRMKQPVRWHNGTTHQPKVGGDVVVFWMVEDGRMADRIPLGLVDVRVQTGIVVVRDGSSRFGLGVETDSVGSTHKEGIAWTERLWQVQVVNKQSQIVTILFAERPMALPHDFDTVPQTFPRSVDDPWWFDRRRPWHGPTTVDDVQSVEENRSDIRANNTHRTRRWYGSRRRNRPRCTTFPELGILHWLDVHVGEGGPVLVLSIITIPWRSSNDSCYGAIPKPVRRRWCWVVDGCVVDPNCKRTQSCIWRRD